jgi:hypothetical protein
MIRCLIPSLAAATSLTIAGAQVRQGGVYQIQSESLDSGGGASAAGPYAVQQVLPAIGASASGGVYTLLSGFAGQLGSGGSGSGPAAFLAWQTAIFGGPAEPGAGSQEDPDFDGIPNLLEFAFNLNPETPGTPLALPGATGGVPWIREEELDGQRYVTMEYIRRKNAGDFIPQASTGLTSWLPADFIILTGPTSISGAYERLKLRLGPPVQPGGKVFYRLNAVIQ